MVRGKTPTGLIEDPGGGACPLKNRRRGLLAKADELALLCGVPIGVVCADPRGGETTVVESEEGVLARYRALPPGRRAGHAHSEYVEGLVVKERAKLARVCQGGPNSLEAPHVGLGRMTLDEVRGMLGAVDAALAAAAERRRALGLPPTVDDGAVVETRVDSGPWTGGSSSSDDGGYPMQQQQGPGDANLLQLALWHGGGMMQPDGCYDTMNVMQAAYNNPHHDNPLLHQPLMMVPPDYYHDDMNTMRLQPPYNEQCDVIGNGAPGMDGYQLPMPGNGGDYQGHGGFLQHYDGNTSSYAGAMPDLTMWCPAAPCNAMPAEYPGPSFTGNNNFPDAQPEFLNMVSAGGNDMNWYVDGNDVQGSSNEFHYSGGSSLEDLLFGDDGDE